MHSRTRDNLDTRLRPLVEFNPWTATAGLTPELLAAATRRGRRERAEEAARLGAAIGRALRGAGRALRRLGERLERARRRRAAHAALLRLEPRLLDDIGLGREQLRSMLDGALSAPQPRPAAKPQPARLDAAAGADLHRLAA